MIASIVAPRIMLVGGGAVAELPDLLAKVGLRHPFVVTDSTMVETGLLHRCLDPLERSGVHVELFSETAAEPTDAVVERGAERLGRTDTDCLIAFGGGSPIDTAKAIAILAEGRRVNPAARMRDFKVPYQADHAHLPVIAIPTTAGTGSECTRFTVITDAERDEKMLIAGLGALPMAAVVDYELTFSVPRRTTADTGVDSLTHALEAYVSKRANPISDALAVGAMELIGRHLRRAFAEPHDRAAREAMMLGATQAGLAFSNSSVALVHGMSRPIGAHFHVPHGLSNAMLLPAVTRFSLDAAQRRYAEAARRVGMARDDDDAPSAARALADGLVQLNRDLEVPTPRGFGIQEADWERLLPTMADQALASGSPANNPRVPSKQEIVALYREVWTGGN
jgi:alcohol dehydrogenase class IV